MAHLEFRRLEALYALIASDAGGETGVAGVEWAQRRLTNAEGIVDFSDGASTNPDADRYLAQSFGVFGQAYLSQLVELRLFNSEGVENHTLPLRSQEMGLAVAQAFRGAIGPELEALLTRCIRSAIVSQDDLAALRPILPGRIADGEERQAYEQFLFAAGDDIDDADLKRRDTLLLILLAARELGRRPTAGDVRRLLFESALPIPDRLEPHCLHWEAYQVQDMWQAAAAALLHWALSLMGQFAEGRSPTEIRGEVKARLEDRLGEIDPITWSAFSDATHDNDDAVEKRWRRIMSNLGTPEDRSLDALTLMASLDRRVRVRDDLAEEIVRAFALGGRGRSIRSELRWFDERRQMPVAAVVADYVVDRIVRRHTWVATQKLRLQRDYTFLFESRDGRLVYRAQYDPIATTPRLEPAIQILKDIHLLGEQGATPRGLQMLGALA